MKRLSLIFLALQIMIILPAWRSLPPELPLFYSLPWGKEQLTTPVGLFLLPLLSLGVFFLNLILTAFLAKGEKLIQRMLSAAAAIISLLCLIALIKIIVLVV